MHAMRNLIGAALLLVATVTSARADDLVLYGAGSLREVMAAGEHVDVFTSADVGHARKLVEDGRASVMAVFARNTVCLLSPAAFGGRTDTVLDKLLAPGVRVGVSPPKVDPLGDYTLRLFAAAETLRPGSA